MIIDFAEEINDFFFYFFFLFSQLFWTASPRLVSRSISFQFPLSLLSDKSLDYFLSLPPKRTLLCSRPRQVGSTAPPPSTWHLEIDGQDRRVTLFEQVAVLAGCSFRYLLTAVS